MPADGAGLRRRVGSVHPVPGSERVDTGGGVPQLSSSDPHSLTEEYEARVWDLETLEPLHTLRQAAGQNVLGLASDGGEVWGAVGKDVVVWGRRG